jgi:two-component system nitrogen regulation response regulator NtrX
MSETTPYELTGTSSVVRDAVAQVARAAVDDRGVLITAEPGLDAEAVARAVHATSARKTGPFVVMVCDAASAAELERKLFGAHYRGAAADLELVSPAGVLMRAHGGTLFLGNVNELAAPLQRRLARVLRDGEVRVARRSAVVNLDVRVMASRESSIDSSLRDDLLRRLPVIIDVPGLRQRRDDVPAIAEAMLAARDPERRFTPAALTVLAALPWRRNTAELAGLIERLAASEAGPRVRQEDVLEEVQLDRRPVRAAGSLRDARRQFEREYIASVLRDHEWHMPEAARALGIERANLYRKARQLGIPLRREGEAAASRTTR